MVPLFLNSSSNDPSPIGDGEHGALSAAAMEARRRRWQSYPGLCHPSQGGQWRVGGDQGGRGSQHLRPRQPSVWYSVPCVSYSSQPGKSSSCSSVTSRPLKRNVESGCSRKPCALSFALLPKLKTTRQFWSKPTEILDSYFKMVSNYNKINSFANY